MDYQTILKIPYVLTLVNVILREERMEYKIDNSSISRHLCNIDYMEIVKHDYNFYLKVNNDLIYIDENMKYSDVKKILNTIIYFEKYKNYPLEAHIKRKNHKKELDDELLKSLQLQLLTNKYYFV